MRSQENVRPTFTVIYHDKRIELGLNLLDYILLDTVFWLSQNNKGYCYKTIRSLALDLDMSVGGIHKALKRLVSRELLIQVEGGYKCSPAFVEVIHLKRSQSEQKQRRVHKVNKTDHKVNADVHFVQPQQMLDIQENNNRNTPGSPRVIPREPQLAQPLSPVALKLQQRLKQVQNKGVA